MNRIPFVLIICLSLLISFFSGCRSEKKTIVIGTKNFTEQIILGEILSQLIEHKTDIAVKRTFNLGCTFVCFSALQQGEIDIYPEYTGTGLTAILKKEPRNNKDTVFTIVERAFKQKYNLVWLAQFGFNNTYTITMRKKDADSLSIKNISDLNKYQETLRSGFTSEFLERADGFKGLKNAYHFEFKHTPKELDPGLMYKAIKDNHVDIISGFATDGRIPAYNLTPLHDDKYFFPPYHAAPLIRQSTLEAFPELKNILNVLSGAITDQEMSEMNYLVDNKSQKPAEVAKQFLANKNLL